MSGQQTGNATVDLAGGNTERVATPSLRRLGAPVDAYPGLIGSHIRGRARLAARDELHTAPARRRVAGNLYAIDAASGRWRGDALTCVVVRILRFCYPQGSAPV